MICTDYLTIILTSNKIWLMIWSKILSRITTNNGSRCLTTIAVLKYNLTHEWSQHYSSNKNNYKTDKIQIVCVSVYYRSAGDSEMTETVVIIWINIFIRRRHCYWLGYNYIRFIYLSVIINTKRLRPKKPTVTTVTG